LLLRKTILSFSKFNNSFIHFSCQSALCYTHARSSFM
jgi:hypothetical protein